MAKYTRVREHYRRVPDDEDEEDEEEIENTTVRKMGRKINW